MRWDAQRTVLVDTNLLLVLLVGQADRSRVGSVGRTDGYTADDFERLTDFVSEFTHLVTTPHVLSEVSNLLCKGAVSNLADELREMLKRLSVYVDERFVTARKLYRDSLAAPLGLADSGVIEAASRGCTVVTADLKLYQELSRRGLRAVNFNHIRF